MAQTTRLALSYWLALLCFPLLLWLQPWPLFPGLDLQSLLAKLAYAITMTGTRPWGLLTTALVLGLAVTQLPREKRAPLLASVLLAVAANVLLSHLLKTAFAEPRPYITWLAQHGLVELPSFYQASMQGRQAILQQLTAAQIPIPITAELLRHWQFETGYSFPSGHTLFAATLSLSCSIMLLPYCRWLPLLLLLWAWLLGLSRLLLGMHWPQDVLASAVIAGVISYSCYGLVSVYYARRDVAPPP